MGRRIYLIEIGRLPSAVAVIVLSGEVPDGEDGVAYTATITASGGTSPYTWEITDGGILFAGLELAESATPDSIDIVGTAVSGSFNFVLQATDANAISGEESYSFVVTA